eukprot:TRINITY_DN42465_c0_g1_i1.p1 TRINITY_DN42465_c0_g1~~TRINITY_DN42465_c0_g1_i1.p1  ORF type:complete len:719 (-),score=101.83 TRINITY_DN42465_c0_g1_i1:262-2370(-)
MADDSDLHGCVRVALRRFLPGDEVRVEQAGHSPARAAAVNEDRTVTLLAAATEDVELRQGATVVLQGLVSSPELNGKLGKLWDLDTATGRWKVDVEGAGLKSLRPGNLAAQQERRHLLRDCHISRPLGRYHRVEVTQKSFELVHSTSRGVVTASGECVLDGRTGRTPHREGVHWLLQVATSQPVPAGVCVTGLELRASGMDQGWGNTGDSGIVVYLVRAQNERAAANAARLIDDDPITGIVFDRRRQSSRHHHIALHELPGMLIPQPGDHFSVFLKCPNYPGWHAECEEVRVTVHAEVRANVALPGHLSASWEDQSERAFFRLWAGLGDDQNVDVDMSHLSISGQRQQNVWSGATSSCEAATSTGTHDLSKRFRALTGPCSMPGDVKDAAARLVGKIASNTMTAGAPNDATAREARYTPLRIMVQSTLDSLESCSSSFLEAVVQHYADCADDCLYRWEREIHNMHDLVTGAKTGVDATHAEDAVLQLMYHWRRQLAEELLHRTKGRLENSDMHFESFFYSSINFGLKEQLDARRDPNRLNYQQLNLLRPSELQDDLLATYTPSAIRCHLRKAVFETAREGSQALREKLLDWLRSNIPQGFRPGELEAARQEAWIFQTCHDESFRVTDEALNFLLCGMHILCADRIASPAAAWTPRVQRAESCAAGDASGSHDGQTGQRAVSSWGLWLAGGVFVALFLYLNWE